MGCFIVPVISGELDIDYAYLVEGISASDTQAYVKLRDGFTIRASWQEITEEQFNTAKPVLSTPVPQPTQLDQLQQAVDLLLVKQEGLI